MKISRSCQLRIYLPTDIFSLAKFKLKLNFTMQFWVLRSQEAWSSESKLSPINNSLQTSIGDIIISKCDIIVSKFVDMHEVRGRGGSGWRFRKHVDAKVLSSAPIYWSGLWGRKPLGAHIVATPNLPQKRENQIQNRQKRIIPNISLAQSIDKTVAWRFIQNFLGIGSNRSVMANKSMPIYGYGLWSCFGLGVGLVKTWTGCWWGFFVSGCRLGVCVAHFWAFSVHPTNIQRQPI